MAQKKGTPGDLLGTVGSLLRSTLDQVDAVRDVVEQRARSRSSIVDQALGSRRRRELLQSLGELIVERADQGLLGELQIDPEVAAHLSQLDELEDETQEGRSEAVSSRSFQPQPSSGAPLPVYRPTLADAERAQRARERGDEPEAQPRPQVGRDITADIDADAGEPSVVRSESRGPLPRMVRPAQPGAGLQFPGGPKRDEILDDDSDLESYMNEDDVPE